MTMLQDFRYALRTIRQAPGFSVVVTLTIALGVGATTAMFSVVDAVLLRPLPYPAQASLVKLFDTHGGRDIAALSFPEFIDWRDRGSDVFESMGAYGARGEVLSGVGEAEQLQGVQASLEVPGLLGLRPILGRGFIETDELPGGPPVVVLGEHLWRSHFGADPAIVGRIITLTGVSYQVIGVFPSTASAILPSPYYMARGKPTDFWEPLQLDPKTAPRGLHHLNGIARLRSAVTLAQAAGRVDAIADTIKKDRLTTHGLHVRPLATVLVGDLAAPLALLLTAVALLLLIACGNVANLLLTRSASRGREFAVRTALGADRGRLVLLVMVESVTRAAVGGLFGIGLAYAIVNVARTMLVGTIPRVATAAIDGRVLAVGCGLSLVSGFFFGVTPALRASRRDVIAGLSGARGSVEHLSRDAVRRTLMVGEIALSFVLLVAAALLAESYLRLVNVPKGFNPDDLITARVWLPSTRYAADAAQNAFFGRLTERLAGDFGARAVTLASDLPIEGGTYGGVGLTNPRFPDGAAHVEKRIVSSNYFDVLKARLVRGRFFQPSDVPGSQPVVVVNETFARVWLEGDPIGQNVAFSWGINGTQTVVGVVADVREGGLDEQPQAAVYISRAQRPNSDMHIIVRTSRAASEVMKLIRASVADLDAALPVIDVKSADDIVAASARPQQLTGSVIGAFAVSALVLAAIGLYGLISYSVAQRRQELGVRAAIGARPRDLIQLVLGQSLRVTVIGIVWGAAAALAVSRLLSAQLFGVGGRDPRVYATVALLILVVALLASALPTLRATRANPLDALRMEQ
jgi:putative ABC transport system permease protein